MCPEVVHVTADEVDGCKASNLVAICLPKRTVERPTGMIGSLALTQYFAELHLFEVHRQQALAFTAEVDRAPAVRINHAALITPAAGNLVGMPPEIPELGSVPSDHEYCRRITQRIPTFTRRGI